MDSYYYTMNNCFKIPKYGFGTYEILPDEKCTEACLEALKVGYRLIDTAAFYGNEKGVGEAVRKTDVKREDIFVVTKVWPTQYDDIDNQLEKMLTRIGLEYVDLVLLHWPFLDYKKAWKGLERYVKKGKIKSIGLSNFYEKELKEILEICRIKPVVDELECHPYRNLKDFKKKVLDKENILLISWTPVAKMEKDLFENSVLKSLCEKYKKNAVQIILNWHFQHGFIAIPKSANPVHIKENYESYDFNLTKDEVESMDRIPAKDIGSAKYDDPKFIDYALNNGPKY